MNRIDKIKTIDVLALAFLVAYLIFGVRWLVWISLTLSVFNVFESRITGVIAEYWMKFATVLGNFNSRLILTVIFFVVLTPIAFLFRIFNRQLVDHFRADTRSSYFDDLNKSYEKSDFEKMW